MKWNLVPLGKKMLLSQLNISRLIFYILLAGTISNALKLDIPIVMMFFTQPWITIVGLATILFTVLQNSSNLKKVNIASLCYVIVLAYALFVIEYVGNTIHEIASVIPENTQSDAYKHAITNGMIYSIVATPLLEIYFYYNDKICFNLARLLVRITLRGSSVWNPQYLLRLSPIHQDE